MDSDDRMYSTVWGFLSAAVVAVVLMVSSCVHNDTVESAKVQQACIAVHANWSNIPNTTQYGCQFTK